MKQKRIFGFSLIELMVTLVIVSVVTAAMAPVITKKIKSSSLSVSSVNDVSSNCSEKYSADCKLCLPNKCLSCIKTCPEGQNLNIATCTCSSCYSSFGSECLECSETQCMQCASGYYVNTSGACEACPIGSYCDGINKVVCEDGKYTNTTGQISCTTCPSGYYCVNGIKEACVAGQYSNPGASSCIECEKGYKCEGAKNRMKCGSEAEYQDETGQSVCKQCIAGKYVEEDRTACSVCPSGYKCIGDGTKQFCSGVLEYQSNTGQDTCLSCSNGTAATYVSDDRTACFICPVGHMCVDGEKTACNPGYQDKTGQSTCEDCVGGFVSDDRKSCTLCPESTYASESTCLECPSGYYCTSGVKKACPSGYYCEGGAMKACSTFTANCTLCDAASKVCTNCRLGYYLTLSSNSCTICPAGKACGGGQTTIFCNGTTYQDLEGQSSCKTCSNGLACGSTDGNISCLQNCNACSETSPGKCGMCKNGYSLYADGTCGSGSGGIVLPVEPTPGGSLM
ncbi:MAG: prepilin-type N-terminal cleavage/methylation domain-containing protein [Candidatus Gastranaerophilales bacterium]|nr:prepilin-type N-terminal cleavage/methylation domain-containing protein [Candidatus Gastranaerophilales bacterium]